MQAIKPKGKRGGVSIHHKGSVGDVHFGIGIAPEVVRPGVCSPVVIVHLQGCGVVNTAHKNVAIGLHIRHQARRIKYVGRSKHRSRFVDQLEEIAIALRHKLVRLRIVSARPKSHHRWHFRKLGGYRLSTAD